MTGGVRGVGDKIVFVSGSRKWTRRPVGGMTGLLVVVGREGGGGVEL